jgi:hypothetical protein
VLAGARRARSTPSWTAARGAPWAVMGLWLRERPGSAASSSRPWSPGDPFDRHRKPAAAAPNASSLEVLDWRDDQAVRSRRGPAAEDSGPSRTGCSFGHGFADEAALRAHRIRPAPRPLAACRVAKRAPAGLRHDPDPAPLTGTWAGPVRERVGYPPPAELRGCLSSARLGEHGSSRLGGPGRSRTSARRFEVCRSIR